MSKLTRCNYCTLKRLTDRAVEYGVSIELGKDEYNWITVRYSNRDKPSAYLMQLTNVCVC